MDIKLMDLLYSTSFFQNLKPLWGSGDTKPTVNKIRCILDKLQLFFPL